MIDNKPLRDISFDESICQGTITSGRPGSKNGTALAFTARLVFRFVSPLFLPWSTLISALVSKKARPSQSVVEDVEEYEDESEDLFDSAPSASTSSAATSSKSTVRTTLLTRIADLSRLPALERKSRLSETRVGDLRKIVSLYGSNEDLDELKSVLRTWRVLGRKVTSQTAEEIVGKCCNLKRPELALELLADRSQYGLPELSISAQTRLHQSLISSPSSITDLPVISVTSPLSPTLALLRLALTEKISPEGKAEIGQVVKGKDESAAEKRWKDATMKRLDALGGAWKEAAGKIQAFSA
ncbi:hypothetical protein P7C73_g212, partial [Tremellales sp. Uapishka_1]